MFRLVCELYLYSGPDAVGWRWRFDQRESRATDAMLEDVCCSGEARSLFIPAYLTLQPGRRQGVIKGVSARTGEWGSVHQGRICAGSGSAQARGGGKPAPGPRSSLKAILTRNTTRTAHLSTIRVD